MPAHRKSKTALDLSGATRTNPARYASRSPAPKPAGPLVHRPEDLDEKQVACWDRLLAIAPAGTLTVADEAAVEAAARLWAKIKTGFAKSSDYSMLSKYLTSLGLTPQSRTTIEVPPQHAEENEFAKV
ncbi:hypothetical protein [Nibricoccus aquaticus]|uniref:hypothetical protein n=1 Tax=Nibricoccus aquaticus TaxID=2576891 RepID=UPI0010FF277C|nr:hypothetical protein [Nibricoccus aquaticus]